MPSHRPAAMSVGHVMRPSRSHTSWRRLASSWRSSPLDRGRPRLAVTSFANAASSGCDASQSVVNRAVEDRRIDFARLQLVQWVGGSADSPGRRAQQRESFEPFGRRHGELLCHHPAETDADNAKVIPTDVIRQGEGVSRIVGHRRHVVWFRRSAQPPLVVRQHLEPSAQLVEQERHALQRGPGPVQEEQSGAGPRVFVIHVDSSQGGLHAATVEQSDEAAQIVTFDGEAEARAAAGG